MATYDQIRGLLNQGYDNEQQLAKNQAGRMANEKKNALNSALESARTNTDIGLRRVETGVTDAKQSLEERSFQNYLASRQSMANKGLSGQGLAKEQDTRLSMARQRELSGIERDANNRRFDLEQMFSNVSKDINNQMSGINEEQMAAEIFQQLRGQASNERMQQAGMMMNMINSQFARDQFEWQKDESKLNRQDRNEQFQKNFNLQEGQMVGNYVPDNVRSLVDSIIQAKQNWASNPDGRQQASTQANQARERLTSLGIDANSLFGANVPMDQVLANAGNLRMPTLQSKQLDEQKRGNDISLAINRTNAVGRVANEEDARILGVPVGTPSAQAVQFNESHQLNRDRYQLDKDQYGLQNRKFEQEIEEFMLTKDAKQKMAELDQLIKQQEYDDKVQTAKGRQATQQAISDLTNVNKIPDFKTGLEFITNNQAAFSDMGVKITELFDALYKIHGNPHQDAGGNNVTDQILQKLNEGN